VDYRERHKETGVHGERRHQRARRIDAAVAAVMAHDRAGTVRDIHLPLSCGKRPRGPVPGPQPGPG
jgi:hypothetical protein